jgi:hypothetical protein
MLSPVDTTITGGQFESGQVLKTAGWHLMSEFGAI